MKAKNGLSWETGMVCDSHCVLGKLTEVEMAAEDVFATKQQIIDLDMKRNRNREALNALKNDLHSEKVKVCLGQMFIKFQKSKMQEMIQEDQEQLDTEINDLHKGLKVKVNRLNEMQGMCGTDREGALAEWTLFEVNYAVTSRASPCWCIGIFVQHFAVEEQLWDERFCKLRCHLHI
ncbi:p53 and DNA damage-regulated protein 1 isoform X2 [Stigmatopora argus]